jgi:hypothetical protein
VVAALSYSLGLATTSHAPAGGWIHPTTEDVMPPFPSPPSPCPPVRLFVRPSIRPLQAFPPQLRTGLTYSQNIGMLAAQVGGMEAVKFISFNLAHRLNLM